MRFSGYFYKKSYGLIVFAVARKYLREVADECKKVNYPSWRDTYTTAGYIAVVVVFSALVVALGDFFISFLVKLIFGLGN
jgi:preprotein translocase SecE subunit